MKDYIFPHITYQVREDAAAHAKTWADKAERAVARSNARLRREAELQIQLAQAQKDCGLYLVFRLCFFFLICLS